MTYFLWHQNGNMFPVTSEDGHDFENQSVSDILDDMYRGEPHGIVRVTNEAQEVIWEWNK